LSLQNRRRIILNLQTPEEIELLRESKRRMLEEVREAFEQTQGQTSADFLLTQRCTEPLCAVLPVTRLNDPSPRPAPPKSSLVTLKADYVARKALSRCGDA
jgi:hypothetical protein